MKHSRKPITTALAMLLAMVTSLVAPLPGAAAETHEATATASNPYDNPHQRGPDPTDDSLEAPLGPFEHESIVLPTSQTPGFGAATVYYPTTTEEGVFGAVAIAPGFLSTRDVISWFGPRLASNGFVVIMINTNSLLDQPNARGTQLLAALDFLNSPASPVDDRIDPDRLAVMGHSMGGGGAIAATNTRTSIKASIPLTPYHTTKEWPGVETPTLIIGAQNDAIAPVATHARPLYEGLPDTIHKAYAELAGAGHLVPANPGDTTIAKLSISWLKRFVDDDLRYDPFLCPEPDDPATFSDYRSTCPYTLDSDGDGVPDQFDVCPATVLPDEPAAAPSARSTAASGQRFLADEDGRFVSGSGVDSGLTVVDTRGCSATQIADELDLGGAHNVFGISRSALEHWVAIVTSPN